MKTIMGVDPGAKGAFAFIKDSFDPVVFDYTDDLELIKNIILTVKPDVCYLEKVHSMPGQGVVGVFGFGVNYGTWKGLLAGVCPVIDVSPKKWQKELNIIPEKLETKNIIGRELNRVKAVNKRMRKEASLNLARQKFPHLELHLKKHEGRAEALLITLFGKIKES